MDVDEAGHHHQAAAVDRASASPAKPGPDMDDLVAGEGEVGVLQVDVPAVRLVPGDDQVEVADQRGSGSHGLGSHGRALRKIEGARAAHALPRMIVPT